MLCGYLDPDLKGVADDILLEAGPEPFMGPSGEIEARDLRDGAERASATPEPRTSRAEPDARPTPELEREPTTSPAPTGRRQAAG